MKKRLLLLLLLLGPLGAAAQVRFETKSTDAVREMALRSGKLVLIDLYATWCPPCRLMEREVFSLREVGEFGGGAQELGGTGGKLIEKGLVGE